MTTPARFSLHGLISLLTLACGAPAGSDTLAATSTSTPANTSTSSGSDATLTTSTSQGDTGASSGSIGATTASDTYVPLACDTLLQDCPAGFKCTGIKPCPLAADGQSCVPFYAPGEAPAGLESVGVCAVP